MSTMLIDEPLGITCVFSDGSRREFSVEELPNPLLSRDLATGLVDLIHSPGTADSAGTVNLCIQALRRLVRTLAEHGFTGAPPICDEASWPSTGWEAQVSRRL
ncbi:hypothetical protein ABZU86_34685 [Streptomyces sp. NPDC005271]|uniref:hypothetical protein n=1 Tax=unclassified Streptomyces TaxID=2593676 RepID=UPI0033B729B4